MAEILPWIAELFVLSQTKCKLSKKKLEFYVYGVFCANIFCHGTYSHKKNEKSGFHQRFPTFWVRFDFFSMHPLFVLFHDCFLILFSPSKNGLDNYFFQLLVPKNFYED